MQSAATTLFGQNTQHTQPTIGDVALGVLFTVPSQPHVVFALLQSAGGCVGEVTSRWAVVVDVDAVSTAHGITYGRLQQFPSVTPVILLSQVRNAIYKVA